MILDWRTGSGSLPFGIFPLAHQGDKRGVTLLHKPITPSQMVLSVCGLTAAPCPYLYGHRQSCPGVTQAVSYAPRVLHSTQRWSRLAGNVQALALPFSTQVPDRAVSHTFVQPIDCLMPNPRPGDTYWVIRNLWVEGTCDRTFPVLSGTCAWWAFCEVDLQPASVPCRPPENLPLPPPLRQGANLRPVQKPHH